MNIIIIGIFFLCFILLHSYERDFLSDISKKEYRLFFLFPVSLFFLDKFEFLISKSKIEKRKEAIKLLTVSNEVHHSYRLFMANKIATVIFIFLLFTTISVLYVVLNQKESTIIDGKYIERPAYDESEKSVEAKILVEEDGEFIEKNIILHIEPKEYSSKEFYEICEQYRPYIEKTMLHNNSGLDNITSSLTLIKSIPNTGIHINWTLDRGGVINIDGSINGNKVESEKGDVIDISALLVNGEEQMIYEFTMKVLPPDKDLEKTVDERIQEVLEEQDEKTKTSEHYELPEKINGDQVCFYEKITDISSGLLLLGVIIGAVVGIGIEQDVYRRLEKRNMEVLIDYPEIVNKFTLLIGAGMTTKGAWNRITSEYTLKRKEHKLRKRYAYEEMILTAKEIENGTSEVKAYERFGRRLKMLPYVKFSTLLAQNIKKGVKGLDSILELEAIDAFEGRKELAKRLGEQASTKLLIPMFIMFCIVLVIIMFPAMNSF